jgi:DnaJ family protein A protein 2
MSTEFYDLLKIKKTATKEEIKTAYRQQAKIHHPDKGGDAEQFKRITAAYKVLIDDNTRAIYDKHGKEGLERPNMPKFPTDLNDILGGFFRFFDGMEQAQSTQPLVKIYSVSLEDLCNHKTVKIPIERKRCCPCTANERSTICQECGGQGVKISIIRLNSIMAQQKVENCRKCNGKGRIFGCKNCEQGYIKETKEFEINLTPDMDNNHIIEFEHEGNQEPGVVVGNLVVVLKLEEHKTFKRKNNDLFCSKKITLKEALCGFTISIHHPRGDEVKIENGDIIKPGEVIKIEGQGVTDNSVMHVQFEIVFPEELTEKQKRSLSRNLS